MLLLFRWYIHDTDTYNYTRDKFEEVVEERLVRVKTKVPLRSIFN